MQKNKYLTFIILFGLIAYGFVFGSSEQEPNFSFGVIADIQYCDCDSMGTRFYFNSLKKLSDCVRHFNSRDQSFVIQLGDLIDRNIDSYESVLSIFNKIKSTKYHVLGNHDYNVDKEKQDKVLEKIGLVSRYYDFGLNGWRMIVLDGNDLSFYTPKESSEQIKETNNLFQKTKDRGGTNAHDWNGGLGSQQISWLEDTLKQASLSGEKVLVFCHFPVYPPREENLWNDVELIERLEAYPCVIAHFSGHYHDGNYAKKKGIHYLTLQGMVKTEKHSAYSIVEVYSDHLKVLGYGREPNRILTFRNNNN